MTEFRDILGNVITTKNNMNNVIVGNKIEVNEDDKTKIVGVVSDVVHIVNKWHNHQGLERSTHDIIINIDDKEILRPQKQWKPTEEQMNALRFVYQHFTPAVTDKLAWDSIRTIELMWHDLKKLL